LARISERKGRRKLEEGAGEKGKDVKG